MAGALVHTDALAAQVGHGIDAVPGRHPVLVPLVVDLPDMHERLVVQPAAGVEAVMIARNYVNVAGQQAFRRALALVFQRAELELETVLLVKSGGFHHFPERYVAWRAIKNPNFLLGHQFLSPVTCAAAAA
jgi:hypothetical protein